MNPEDLRITIEATPNPLSAKYTVNHPLLKSGGFDFPTAEEARGSLLPERLFKLDWVRGVYVGANFVTVTKSREVDWNEVAPEAVKVIGSSLLSGKPLIREAEGESVAPADPIEAKIRSILDEEIRPAVAMDGGDITFVSYKEGIVTLNLRGACSSCPSSIMTLRMGVEQRLRQVVPEIKEVVHV